MLKLSFMSVNGGFMPMCIVSCTLVKYSFGMLAAVSRRDGLSGNERVSASVSVNGASVYVVVALSYIKEFCNQLILKR